MKSFKQFLQDESGSLSLEYGMLSVWTAFLAISMGKAIGENVSMTFDKLSYNLKRI